MTSLQTSLVPRMRMLLSFADVQLGGCPYVRAEALQATIWLASPADLDEGVASLLLEELQTQQCQPQLAPMVLAHRILACLCDRLRSAIAQLPDDAHGHGDMGGGGGGEGMGTAEAAQRVVEWAINILGAWCEQAPQRLDMELLRQAWQMVAELRPIEAAHAVTCQDMLFRSLLRIVDYSASSPQQLEQQQQRQPLESSANVASAKQVSLQANVAFQLGLYWFLGEFAPVLCGATRRAAAAERAIAGGGGGIGAVQVEPETDLLLRLQHEATFAPWQVSHPGSYSGCRRH
eukprot:COSAG01_NODE_692_length_14213_cov_3.971518_3_plen_290_part_00